jgi:hypothetical protein
VGDVRLKLRSPGVRSHFNLAPIDRGDGVWPTSEERRLDWVKDCSAVVEGETGGKLERVRVNGEAVRALLEGAAESLTGRMETTMGGGSCFGASGRSG